MSTAQPIFGFLTRAILTRGIRTGRGLVGRRAEPSRTAAELYGRVVAQARTPWFYRDLGVGDTPEGRLEMVMLHVALVLHRLKALEATGAPSDAASGSPGEAASGSPGKAAAGERAAPDLVARSLVEAFVTDIDDCLREMGVGDMTVAKKVKKAAAALFDRSRDYGEALAASDPARLEALTAAHLVGEGNPLCASRLADYARASAERLAALAPADITGARIAFAACPSE